MTKRDSQLITDLARPRLPFLFKAVNVIGGLPASRFVKLDENDLLATARRKTGLHEFGDEFFREPLRVLLNALETEANLSAFGRFAARKFILQLLSTRLLIQDMVNRYPEILEERIEKPIIIAGLPRTGTTHLHNLMSQDPDLRFIPYWESLEPILPENQRPKPGQQDPRINRCEQALKMMQYVLPLFSSMHEITADGAHEEIQLLAIDFSTMLFESMYIVPSYRDWYKANEHTCAYDSLRLSLQVLQWQSHGRKRWVLKSPQHLEQFHPLISAFPDASIIQTHRDPVRITASFCTMIAYSQRMNASVVEPLVIGRYWADRVEDLLRASVEDRRKLPEGKILDIRFHEYMADQISMVERVYEFLGQPMTDAASKAIRAFKDANPKGKHGSVLYRLKDFGLDPDERREALRFYCEFFGIPVE
ncbi:MAG: sulfotransferase [Deltaproteobacteria bacterium]|nr:sulfotransferase [Deltaproteobacteria bacterium]